MVRLRLCKTALLCLVLLSVALLASSASAVNIYVSPAGDGERNNGYVESGGSSIMLRYYYYGGGSQDYRRGIMEIPISSLRSTNLTGATITLNYYVAQSTNAGTHLSGGRFEGDGAVTSADYTRSGSMDFLAAYMTMTPGWNSVNVASYVRNQLTSGYSWANFYFEPADDSTAVIGSAEGGKAAYLNVIPVPEPSSLLALGGGLISLAGLIRRKK
jgi:hypothetical protein